MGGVLTWASHRGGVFAVDLRVALMIQAILAIPMDSGGELCAKLHQRCNDNVTSMIVGIVVDR